MKRILIANRGEIAVRIISSAAAMGFETVAVYSSDDRASLHVAQADQATELPGRGPVAYLNIDEMIAAAQRTGCDAVHPGYGFLAENANFARGCIQAGLSFVGPSPETLELFGNKASARGFAARCGVPVLAGTGKPTTLEDAKAFFAELKPGSRLMIKAVAGGGGRGIRIVDHLDEIDGAYAMCQNEALRAFGDPDVYVERFMAQARHIEVQVAGDKHGTIAHLGERECSIQRRNQKLIEIAPAPNLGDATRQALYDAALTLASSAGYHNLGTFEFLVDVDPAGSHEFAFIEANARLQVEHTVTEEVTGLDLVAIQLGIASGKTLDELGLHPDRPPRFNGMAMQLRVNMERLGKDGTTMPAGGTLQSYQLPFGRGVRVDTYGYAGYRTNPAFDSLLAKVVCHAVSTDFEALCAQAYRALCSFHITGVDTNIALLQTLLKSPFLKNETLHTRLLDDNISALVADLHNSHPNLFVTPPTDPRVGNARASDDPLAVLEYGRLHSAKLQKDASRTTHRHVHDSAVFAPMQGTVASVEVESGQAVAKGQRLIVIEAMKMLHNVTAPASGIVTDMIADVGDTIQDGEQLLILEHSGNAVGEVDEVTLVDLDRIRPDLQALFERRALLMDDARPEAVARRRKTGQRTARENVTDLCDEGSFVEYGGFTIAAQRTRRSLDDLIRNTPADGLITGIATVNADDFGSHKSRCAVLSYDYTVLAGTQGQKNHDKTDRMLEIAAHQKLPVVIFTEGGGGRPGDTDVQTVGGLHVMAFRLMAKLSGLVPLVGINSGRCFAGNAALLGCCDVIIATQNSSIGMGGPAMIEGGGLGVFTPEEVGPMRVQTANGVVDIDVEDEAEAVKVAKQYLSYFQGTVEHWDCADQRRLRHAIPENRLEVYDVRKVITLLSDTDSVLELRATYGLGMVTSLVRIEGRPVGIIANNPRHLAGAIDSAGADKAARFLQLCDAFDIPVLFLCDTPGMMVGPEVEKTALVRHCSRMFVVGANITIPFFTIVLRKSYGLGAQAMAGGSFRAPGFTVAWPTGEFGGMGIEGAVKLGFRKELAAIEDPEERRARFDDMVARAYERGKALSTASYFELDDVIDPAASRARIIATLNAFPPPPPRYGKKRPNIDTW